MIQNRGFDVLMHEVCVDRGWCGSIDDGGEPRHVTMLIPDASLVTADQFVRWVFQADGVDSESEPGKWEKHKLGLRDAFVRHMGGDVVEAERLAWDVG